MNQIRLPLLVLKKNEDRRLRAGHLWVYSNEVDTAKTGVDILAWAVEAIKPT